MQTQARFSLMLLGLSWIAGAVAAQPTISSGDSISSPRLREIRRQVDSGRTNTADFWSAVAKEGTPLVEPFDASYDLVTFLWRAEPDIFSEPIDHDGISVSFLDKYAITYYSAKGKWYEAQTAD